MHCGAVIDSYVALSADILPSSQESSENILFIITVQSSSPTALLVAFALRMLVPRDH